MEDLLTEKMFRNCNPSHLRQHTINQSFFVFYREKDLVVSAVLLAQLKGKAVPVQASIGPGDCRRLIFPAFKT
jgi:hypothetical protein